MTQTTLMTRALRVVLVSTLAAQCLYARLGESETACDVRYNPHGGNVREIMKPTPGAGPVSVIRSVPKSGGATNDIPKTFGTELVTGPNTVTRQFSFEGWVISIGFREGRAARLTYEHEDPAGKFNGKFMAKLTDEEIKAILAANISGGAWREVPVEQPKDDTARIRSRLRLTAPPKPSRVWIRADGAMAYVDGGTPATLRIEDTICVQRRNAPPKKPAPQPPPIPAF